MADENKEVTGAEKLDLDDLNAAVGGTIGNAHKSDTKDMNSTLSSIGNGHKSPTGN